MRPATLASIKSTLNPFLLIKSAVNAADMVAGAVLAKETGKGDEFYKVMEKRVISYKKLNWVEAKKKLFR